MLDAYTLMLQGSNTLKQRYKERAHLKAGYSCLSYGGNASGEKSSYGVVALGTKSGRVVLWDLAEASHKELTHVKSALAISDIAISNDGSKIYTCSKKNRAVLEWDVESGEVEREFIGGKPGVLKLCLSPDGNQLLTAGPNLRLWDLETGMKIKRFVGHSGPTTLLKFINDDTILSACDDRFLSIWNCTGTKPTSSKSKGVPNDKKPMLVLASPSAPHSVSVWRSNKSSCRVIVCTSTDIFAWDLKLETNSQIKSFEPSFRIKGRGAVECCLKNEKECFCVRLIDDKQRIERVMLKSIFAQNTDVSQAASKGLQTNATEQDEESKDEPSEEEKDRTKLHKKITVEAGTSKVPMSTSADISAPVMAFDDSRPLGERVKEMTSKLTQLTNDLLSNGDAASANVAGKRKRQPETAASLSTALEQALQANDVDMIESCLTQTDSTIIATTVSRLSTSRVVSFIEVLVKKYEARPSRSRVLLTWLEAILKHHAAFLISVPDLNATLGGLYESMKARAKLLEKYVHLSSRLDFLVSQVEVQTVSKQLEDQAKADFENGEESATITYAEEL